jgi:ribosomal protein L37AE/L43A
VPVRLKQKRRVLQMIHDRKFLQSYAQRLYKIFDQIYHNENEDTLCPYCGQNGLSISYTQNENDNYGIWIECAQCNLLEHADVKGKPAGFKADLVRPKFQQLDDRAWQSGKA